MIVDLRRLQLIFRLFQYLVLAFEERSSLFKHGFPWGPQSQFAEQGKALGSLIKKLQRVLQRHFKKELFVRLSVLRLFYVGNIVQNRQSAL